MDLRCTGKMCYLKQRTSTRSSHMRRMHTYIHTHITLHYITLHYITLQTYIHYIHTYMHTVMFGSSLTDPSRPRMSVVGSPRRSPPCRRRKSLFGPRWIHHRLRSRASYFPWRTLRSREQESDLRNGLRQRVGKGQAARGWRIDAWSLVRVGALLVLRSCVGKTHAGRCAKIPRAGCAAQVQSFASLCTVQRGSVGALESCKALGFGFLHICAGAVIDWVMRRCVLPPGPLFAHKATCRQSVVLQNTGS